MKIRKNIVDMTGVEAKKFLLKQESYLNSNLPGYIGMEKVLELADDLLTNKTLGELSLKKDTLSKHEEVNHMILVNKDGNHAWRPIELIHPIVYVDLVNTITKTSNWKKLCERIEELQNQSKVECISLPLESQSNKSDTAEVILNWWENLEQAQISYAIEYEYCGHSDVTNCYGSIYTHTISWAIHSKEWAKTHRKPSQGVGNKIDSKISYMRNGQTNGIPQGSVLMDFIAEIVLLYADKILTDRLNKETLSEFHIIRYRDDYRVFSNSKGDVERIIKILSEVLAGLNMKLNPNKTFISSDIIKDAVKPDKFPHSGSIKRALTDIYKYRISKLEKTPNDIKQLISLTINIMVNNPNTIEHCVVVLSKLVTLIEPSEIPLIIDKILKKFENVPNTSFVEIWLQRLTIIHDRGKHFESGLCKKVKAPNECSIWNSDWLKEGFDESSLIDEKYIEAMDIQMSVTEIDLFTNVYDTNTSTI